MNDLRALLDAEMGEPPASTVRVERVIARQRRAGRVRRGGTAMAGLAVVAAAVGVGLPDRSPGAGPVAAGTGTGSPAGSPAATCPPTTPSPTPPPSPWITPGAPTTAAPEPPSTLPVDAAGRLTAALTAAARNEPALRRLGPVEVDDRARPALQFFGGPCDPEFADYYLAVATVLAADGTPAGRLDVYVQTSTDTMCTPMGGGGGCRLSRGPGGEVIRSRVFAGDLQGQQLQRAFVAVEKPDGTVLQVSADGPGGASRPAPLDLAALTRIALTPGLTLD